MARTVGTQENLAALEAAYKQVVANAASSTVFVDVVDSIDWPNQPPALFKQAVDMALSLEAIHLARRLANLGHELHPDHVGLARIARIIAPPRVIDANRPPVKGISATMEWLAQHAGEYYGQWVAVQAGRLLGASASRKELVEALGELSDQSDILITRLV
jgi:hypothetical protein